MTTNPKHPETLQSDIVIPISDEVVERKHLRAEIIDPCPYVTFRPEDNQGIDYFVKDYPEYFDYVKVLQGQPVQCIRTYRALSVIQSVTASASVDEVAKDIIEWIWGEWYGRLLGRANVDQLGDILSAAKKKIIAALSVIQPVPANASVDEVKQPTNSALQKFYELWRQTETACGDIEASSGIYDLLHTGYCGGYRDAVAAMPPRSINLPSEDEAVEIMEYAYDYYVGYDTDIVCNPDALRDSYRALLAHMTNKGE